MKKSRLFNKSGFSLIELMVVVAIIGILAAIGIPQYSKFQAKTRQSEAKSSLSTLYTSEISFMGEWNQYTQNLRNIGFGVAGTRLRYATGFLETAGCTNYVTTGGAPPEWPAALGAVPATSQGWSRVALSCGDQVNVGVTVATFNTSTSVVPTGGSNCVTAAAYTGQAVTDGTTASSCVSTVGGQVFTAVSFGDPNANLTANAIDGWSIDQAKLLRNITNGIQ